MKSCIRDSICKTWVWSKLLQADFIRNFHRTMQEIQINSFYEKTQHWKFYLWRHLEVVHLELVGFWAKWIQTVLIRCFFKAISFLWLRTFLHHSMKICITSEFKTEFLHYNNIQFLRKYVKNHITSSVLFQMPVTPCKLMFHCSTLQQLWTCYFNLAFKVLKYYQSYYMLFGLQ